MKILFITWDAPIVNYVESLFLPAFVRLKKHGVHVDILQFRWGDKAARDKLAATCESAGIGYVSVALWRWPTNMIGTVLTIIRGRSAIREAVRKLQPDAIMPRSLFAAMAALLAGGSKLRPMIFDSDGLEADSRVEGLSMSQSALTYRIMREVEAQAARTSHATLARTEFNADVIRVRAGPLMAPERLHVMTCGRDPDDFRPASESERIETRRELGFGPLDPVVLYVGSVWKQYRTDDVARFVRELRKRNPATRLLLLTGQVDEARQRLREGDEQVASEAVVMRARPEDVPKLISAADVGMSLFTVGFGSRAQSPIKLGEYLMCGVPVIGTPEVGDTAPAIDAGVFFDEGEGIEAAADWVLEEVMQNRAVMGAKARDVGVARFSLDRTVEQYLNVIDVIRKDPIQERIAGAASAPSLTIWSNA